MTASDPTHPHPYPANVGKGVAKRPVAPAVDCQKTGGETLLRKPAFAAG